ncbi:hypothetical protein [Sphingomonas carotinifaciens]|uniref:hypothetical protein n=1 Tax=Sphingomonas carotinifaciens TaxID=1166323 RepID=UPI000DD6D2C6|nr:hypothetical protein [Sphingomonas carotinifaciens]
MTAALALLRRFWWAIPIIGLAAALLITRETLADRTATLTAERQAWTAEIDRAERQRAEIEKRNADRLVQATATYADRLAVREPIILRSTNTVREYATTDAGRLRCRGADRVRAIDALDAELADPAPPAGSGAGPLPADAPAPAG